MSEPDLGLREADCGCCYVVDKVAFEELMARAGDDLPEPSWHVTGDLGRMSIEAMSRRGTPNDRFRCDLSGDES